MADTIKTLEDMVNYVQITSELINHFQEKVAALESENAELVAKGSIEVEKTAAVIDASKVSATVQKLVKASLLKEADAKQFSEDASNPEMLLALLDKLASARQAPRSLGKVSTDKVFTAPTQGKESDRAYENCFSKLAQRL